ncbi:MAG: GAF domain-containing protein [Conchiformibius sp.]|nr:GAF domain-containing protein [Conchiformibius sp.]
MSNIIRDYLQTQSLNLDPDAVRVAQAAAEAVIRHAAAAVEMPVLWPPAVAQAASACGWQPDTEQLALIQSVFIALDSACSRLNPQAAAVYGLMPEQPVLLRLAQQGGGHVASLPADGSADDSSLVARSAHTGWLNCADDVAAWLANGDLSGTQSGGSQAALPVAAEDGRVFGVVSAVYHNPAAFDRDTLADWVGLTLALQPLLAQLLPKPTPLSD